MPNCHQCRAVLDGHARDGDCKVCHAVAKSFCKTCAMWELGPRPYRDLDMQTALKMGNGQHRVMRRIARIPNGYATLSDISLAGDTFLALMGRVCPYVHDQVANGRLFGGTFKAHAKKVLKAFQDLYPRCKYDRAAIQVLLVMHLSAFERVRCRTTDDGNGGSTDDAVKFVKRWQVRELARAHLVKHLDAIEATLNKFVRDQVELPAMLDALGWDDFEFFLKGFKHPTLTAIDLKAASGDQSARVIEIATILYHSLTAARSKAEWTGHWSHRTPDFKPGESLGNVSERHFETLYGASEEATPLFHQHARDEINRLWRVVDDVADDNKLPAHPRYADGAAAGDARLTAGEKSYLQYLPRFDTPEARRDTRSECEQIVRGRVVTKLKAYRDNWLLTYFRYPTVKVKEVDLPASTGKLKTIVLRQTAADGTFDPLTMAEASIDFRAGNVGNVQTDVAATETGKLDTFVTALLADRTALFRQEGVIYVEMQRETGNTRRTTRATSCKDALTTRLAKSVSTHPQVEHDGTVSAWGPRAFTDDLIAKMWSDFVVDQAFDVGVARSVIDKATAGQKFEPMAWFRWKTVDVALSRVFPACGFGVGDTFRSVTDHYVATVGSSPRGAHYMDWRNHKDHWLYDGFDIPPARRPVFASLSMQPSFPEPNIIYGGHALFYKRTAINSRCIFNFGDKQQPRRSMLLLLDDLLFERKKKDSDAGQPATGRNKVVEDLLRRHDRLTLDDPLATVAQRWERAVTGTTVPYHPFGGDFLIECQIFGPIDLDTDAWGFVTQFELAASPAYDPTLHKLTTDEPTVLAALHNVYPQIELLPYRPTKSNPKVGAQRQVVNMTVDPTRSALLDVKAKDFVDPAEPADP